MIREQPRTDLLVTVYLPFLIQHVILPAGTILIVADSTAR